MTTEMEIYAVVMEAEEAMTEIVSVGMVISITEVEVVIGMVTHVVVTEGEMIEMVAEAATKLEVIEVVEWMMTKMVMVTHEVVIEVEVAVTEMEILVVDTEEEVAEIGMMMAVAVIGVVAEVVRETVTPTTVEAIEAEAVVTEMVNHVVATKSEAEEDITITKIATIKTRKAKAVAATEAIMMMMDIIEEEVVLEEILEDA